MNRQPNGNRPGRFVRGTRPPAAARSGRTQPPQRSNGGPTRVRLQKFLSDAGIASRRRAEELILEGHVLVNDSVVEKLPAFVDPASDRIVVDGAPVQAQAPTYFLVHKPKGFVCTTHDPDGRPRAVDLLPPIRERLFAVGRLDADTSGLLLMSNDGELAARITHPRYGIPKKYRVEIRGKAPSGIVERMREGVHFSEGRASASEVEVVHRGVDRSVLIVTLRESRNRQVRRMLSRLGFPVKELKRVQIGPLTLKGLPLGAARELSPPEVAALREAIENAPPDAVFEMRIRRRRRRRPETPAGAGRPSDKRAGPRGHHAPSRRARVGAGAAGGESDRSSRPHAPPRQSAPPRREPARGPDSAPAKPRRRIIQ